MKTLVALPAYNEERYIGSLVHKVKRYADEVLVVDDGSRDSTTEIATLAGATVIRCEENKGKGAAVQRILAEARKRDPAIVVLCDADYQHSPEDIPSLVEPISWGFDIVIGSRVKKGSNTPPYRRVGQRVLSQFSRILSGHKIFDSECGFRALSPKAVAILELKQNGFAIETEMIAVAKEKGLSIAEVPVSTLYTEDGSTLNPIRHGLGVLSTILSMISERKPLFFFGLGGGILIVLGLIAGFRTLSTVSTVGIIPTGTALITVLLLIVGVFSISTGIILNTLAKRSKG